MTIMSAAGSWDLRILRDPSELEDLWATARRHGVEPGGHLRVVEATEGSAEQPPQEGRPGRKLRFAGMGSGPSDISAHVDRYLAEGFGER